MDNLLENSPVICAVRSEDDFNKALTAPPEVIFCLSSDILNVSKRAEIAHKANKKIFFHIDFCEGLGKDAYGIKYLKHAGADGIITTKNNLISIARENEIKSVQRFFIIDSLSVSTAMEIIRHSKPNMIEIMPGVLPFAIKRFSQCKIPLIAGGLIQTKADIMDALNAGATSVSTANKELWYL